MGMDRRKTIYWGYLKAQLFFKLINPKTAEKNNLKEEWFSSKILGLIFIRLYATYKRILHKYIINLENYLLIV